MHVGATIAFAKRPSSFGRWLLLALVLGTCLAILVLAGGGAAVAQKRKPEVPDVGVSKDSVIDAITFLGVYVRLDLTKFQCRSQAEHLIGTGERLLRKYGNFAVSPDSVLRDNSPGLPTTGRDYDIAVDAAKATVAKLKALPPCKLKSRIRSPSKLGAGVTGRHVKPPKKPFRLPQSEDERPEIGGGPRQGGTTLPCSVGGGQDCVAANPSFQGPFVGVHVVGSFSRVNTFEFFDLTGMRTNAFGDRGSGAGGGINFGWNWQPWTPTTLFGVVVDINGLNDSVRRDFAGGNSISSVVNVTASVQLRGGVLAVPSLLLYGQGGFVVANEELKIDFGGPKTDENQLVPGGTIGFGAEWKLATNPLPFGRSFSLFGEYGRTWWGDARLRMPAASPLFDYTWRRETDTVKFGARINWGDGPPQ